MSDHMRGYEGEQVYGFNSHISNDIIQQFHALQEEHQELTKELLDTRDNFEKATSEKESLMKFYQSLKQQLQSKVDENEADKKQIRDLELSYRELEEQAKSEIKKLKNRQELLKRDLEEREFKQASQVDPEVQRIKIRKEMKAMFSSELSAKQYQIDRLNEELHEAKRQNETMRINSEWVKEEKDREIMQLKNKHKLDNDEMIAEIQSLNHKMEGESRVNL
jgi:chromosome segregation ATPase